MNGVKSKKLKLYMSEMFDHMNEKSFLIVAIKKNLSSAQITQIRKQLSCKNKIKIVKLTYFLYLLKQCGIELNFKSTTKENFNIGIYYTTGNNFLHDIKVITKNFNILNWIYKNQQLYYNFLDTINSGIFEDEWLVKDSQRSQYYFLSVLYSWYLKVILQLKAILQQIEKQKK